jgi:hypothetical protein
MSRQIRIGESSRSLSLLFFFLMHGQAFLGAEWDMKQRSAMTGLAAGDGLLSGARELVIGAPSDAVNTQFSASQKIVCGLNQKFEALIWRLKILASSLLNPICRFISLPMPF